MWPMETMTPARKAASTTRCKGHPRSAAFSTRRSTAVISVSVAWRFSASTVLASFKISQQGQECLAHLDHTRCFLWGCSPPVLPQLPLRSAAALVESRLGPPAHLLDANGAGGVHDHRHRR